MNNPVRRYEKVDDHTLRIIVEKPADVSIAQLLENRQKIVDNIKLEQDTIRNIDEMLTECTRLNIYPKNTKPEKQFDNPEDGD